MAGVDDPNASFNHHWSLVGNLWEWVARWSLQATSATFELDALLVAAMDAGRISNEDAKRLRREYQEFALSLLPNPKSHRRNG